MLHSFRTKKIAAFSALLIILSLIVKMMMPVAHASTAVNGERTGFFAALCTANGIVLVNTNHDNAPFEASHKTKQVDSANFCPLCLLLEQGLYDSTALHSQSALNFAPQHAHLPSHQQALVHAFTATQKPIRAPPLFS